MNRNDLRMTHVVMVIAITAVTRPFITTVQSAVVTSDQLRKRSIDNEQSRRVQEEALERVIFLREQLVQEVDVSARLLEQLESQATKHINMKNSLLESDDGKRMALNSVAVMSYIQHEDYPVVSLEEIKQRIDQVAALRTMVEVGNQEPEVGFLPDIKTQGKIHEVSFWVRDRIARLSVQEASLNAFISQLPENVDLSNTKPLRAVVQDYRAFWPKAVATARLKGEELAKDKSQEALISTFELAEMQRARAEQDRILAQTEDRIARLKLDYEIQLLEHRQMREKEHFLADQRYKDATAEIARLKKLADATRAATDMGVDTEADDIIQRAEYERKLALAKSIEVRELLKPFIAKSYWQPNRSNRGYERTPMSYTLIRKQRCLVQTPFGLAKLLTLGTNPDNKERGPWAFPRKFKALSPVQEDQIRQAQKHLIELGPILVKLGYLAE